MAISNLETRKKLTPIHCQKCNKILEIKAIYEGWWFYECENGHKVMSNNKIQLEATDLVEVIDYNMDKIEKTFNDAMTKLEEAIKQRLKNSHL